MRVHFLTLFPDVIESVLNSSLLGKAQEVGHIEFHVVDIRDFAEDKHHTVDEPQFGGGPGMVLKVDVLYRAWKSIVDQCAASPEAKRPHTLYLSPQGKLLSQANSKEWLSHSDLILVSGHYEGIDERFIELCVDQEVSIGDYVLTGGELPALVLVDVLARQIPGVLGNQESLVQDSLWGSTTLKAPVYTRPREFMGKTVPDVLLSGNHEAIRSWREEQGRVVTQKKRPDLA